jgi:ubiquinone/menaquinone biosynthesis C-methylase UbiE
MTNRPRLLIVTRGLATLRTHYEDVIAALAEAGVEVSIRFIREKRLTAEDYRQTLFRRGCDVQLNRLPPDKREPGALVALRLRQLGNLLRYYHPDYRGSGWLRDYWFSKAPPGPARWARRLGRLGGRPAMLATRLADAVDRALPPSKQAEKIVAQERPDAVVAVGVLWIPEFVDLLKAAAQAGIPTAHWVQSWDNLTNKGLLHFPTDRVFVWNDVQRRELARYHGVRGERVFVTGAQTFDYWFAGEGVTSRTEFCRQVGLDSERPMILYLASSQQIEPPPARFFLRWLEAVRSSGDPLLAEAGVLVRPHPTVVRPWLELAARHPNLSVSPSTTEAPLNSEAYRRRFRNELHHASVAVGLNTSGMIDAAILGKPVCTVELPDIPNRQRGTLHFEYLVTVGGGFVRTATTFDEHVRTLAELVRRDPYERDERSANFVRAFVRPHGLEVTPATVFSDEMLRLIRSRSQVRPPNPLEQAIGRLIERAAPVHSDPVEKGQSKRLPAGMALPRRRSRRVESYWTGHTVRSDSFATPEESEAYLGWRFAQYPLFQEITGLWGDHAGKTLLDYGCGPGNDVVGLLLYSGAAKVIGMDVSPTSIRLAADRLALHRVAEARFELVQLSESARRLPLEDGSVDFINCQGVLHHATNPARILREFRRVLGPSGRAVVMVYNRDSIWFHLYVPYMRTILEGAFPGRSVDDAFRASTDGPECPISRAYRPVEFVELCRRAGFETSFSGGYFNRHELDWLREHRKRALQSPQLANEHKRFLRELTSDEDGRPLYGDKHCGIGGVYHLRPI